MSENPISASALNDFIFCPVSIYFHALDPSDDEVLTKDIYQINGTDAHKKSDTAAYSTKKSMLQGIGVYSAQYDVCGKIDTFDIEKGILTERKKRIKTVYDGYIFQLYAQYFSLTEMGYHVNALRLYSMDDNRIYPVKKPSEDLKMYSRFEKLIRSMQDFAPEAFTQTNPQKCRNCIYESLCSYSACKEVEKQC